MELKRLTYGEYKKAIEEARAVASEGSPEEQFRLGSLYSSPDFRKKHWSALLHEGVHLIQVAANRGNFQAMEKLAKFHKVGLVVPKDFSEALRWTKLAAEKGSLKSQLKLGEWYKLGARRRCT